jgi:hypothetical protein
MRHVNVDEFGWTALRCFLSVNNGEWLFDKIGLGNMMSMIDGYVETRILVVNIHVVFVACIFFLPFFVCALEQLIPYEFPNSIYAG